MTKNQWFNLGLNEMEAGNIDEGRRWLLYALQDEQLDNKRRAIAYTWLAEATDDRAQKRAYFEAAVAADPNNDFAQDKLNQLLRPQRQPPPPPPTIPEAQNNPLVPPRPPAPIFVPSSPPPPPRAAPVIQEPPPISPAETEYRRTNTGTLRPVPPTQHRPRSDHYIVGILGGPNGRGSGFFLTTSGIIVTTRHVVGGSEAVTVELEPGNQFEAQVVRSFPEVDVALLYSQHGVRELLPTTIHETLPENAPLTVMAYQSPTIEGHRRETGRAMASHLFPTDIVQVPDAGGGPVFNHRQDVVGMITRNISGSSAYVYGVHYVAIKRGLDRYNHELQSVAERVYCASCGYASAVGAVDGYYCEVCGTVMPHAQDKTRVQHHRMAAYYGENTAQPCLICRATVGYYQGFCLRCGQAGNPDQRSPGAMIR